MQRQISETMKKNKPFVFGVATTGEHFTDREKETARLVENFRHGVNTILISPRRWGKTSLVRKVCKLAAADNLKIVYLDIFSCRSEHDFYTAFAEAVIKQTSSKWDEWLDDAKDFLARISPKISLGTDPMSEFSLSLSLNTKSEEVEDILQLPERIAAKKNCRIVICIDEFQQVAEFDNAKAFQKRLRSIWQLQTRVSYCLFGSKQHLMNELFEKKSLPFYKFGDAIYLPKIGTEDWIAYICERFQATSKRISEDLAREICTLVDNHSSYVQQLAWLVWVQTTDVATEQHLQNAYQDLLDQNTPLFEQQVGNLTTYQMNFLRALTNGVHKEFTSKEVLQTYQLGSSANVARLKNTLIQKELIEIEKGRIVLSDPVMKGWLKQLFLTP